MFDGTKDEDGHLVGCNKIKDIVNILEYRKSEGWHYSHITGKKVIRRPKAVRD